MATAASRPPLRRDAIVEAARDLISTDGLDALTLRRLADRFSVTAPALYAHFQDKDDLLRAVAALQFEQLMATYREIDERSDPSRPLDRVRAQCRNYVEMSRDDPELFKVMFLFPPDLGDLVPVAEGGILNAATEAFFIAVGAVADAIDAGDLHADDPMTVALSLWAAVHGVTGLLQLGLDLSDEAAEAMVDEVTGRILIGYGATDADVHRS